MKKSTSSPRARKIKKIKKVEKPEVKWTPRYPGDTDPVSPDFREEFPWTADTIPDAYTGIEAKLFVWFEKEGILLGRGAILDLAVRMSACIEPFRSHYRATQGWSDYDLETCRQKAKLAEETL